MHILIRIRICFDEYDKKRVQHKITEIFFVELFGNDRHGACSAIENGVDDPKLHDELLDSIV